MDNLQLLKTFVIQYIEAHLKKREINNAFIGIMCEYLDNNVSIKTKKNEVINYIYISPNMSFYDIVIILDNLISYVLVEEVCTALSE